LRIFCSSAVDTLDWEELTSLQSSL